MINPDRISTYELAAHVAFIHPRSHENQLRSKQADLKHRRRLFFSRKQYKLLQILYNVLVNRFTYTINSSRKLRSYRYIKNPEFHSFQ